VKKRVPNRHKYIEKAAGIFKEDMKDLDSTKYAESMDGSPHYQIKAEYPAAIPARV